MKKTSVLLLSGGQSAEHEISIRSARFIADNIDKKRFRLTHVRIEKDGRWRLAAKSRVGDPGEERVLLPKPGPGRLFRLSGEPAEKIDIVFPVIHGTTGEDGCLPGLFELAGIPYVGCTVLGSAVGMDKIVQKSILRDKGLAVTNFIGFSLNEWKCGKKKIIADCGRMQGPWFVKPSAQGSSVGISRVESADKLTAAVRNAFRYDSRVLVETAVNDPRELEVAVIMTGKPTVTSAAEITSSAVFYDYKAKYESTETVVEIPARIGERLESDLRKLAVRAATALAVQGYCRVDFLYDKSKRKLFVNEINTVPGMTEASAFPRLCETAGLSGREMISRLVDLGLAEFEERRSLNFLGRQN